MLYRSVQFVMDYECLINFYYIDVRQCICSSLCMRLVCLWSWRGNHQPRVYTAVVTTSFCPPEGMFGAHARLFNEVLML